MLIGQHFQDYFVEETISIDLVSTQKPEEPELYQQGEKKPKYTELSKRLTQIKKTEEKVWLSEVFSIPLQQSLRDLETAYSNFFASC